MTQDLYGEMDPLAQAALEELGHAATTDGGVQLPYPTFMTWVLNGSSAWKKQAKDVPAAYFGGWATDLNRLDEMIQADHLPAYPEGWAAFEGQGRGSTTWEGLCSRTVTFAFIASRSRWLNKEGKGKPKFNGDAGYTRRHVQTLGQMWDVYPNAAPQPYAPAVFSAKGYQALNLLKAIGDWDRAITKFRKEIGATRVPISGFLVTVGTFAADREVEMVGPKGGSQSPITPIRAVIPANFDAKMARARFIGAENVQGNADMLSQAKPWLEAWKFEQPEAEGEDEDVPPDEGEDIPF